MTNIEYVNWDVDKVWYPGISTSYCAAGSTHDPQPYLQDFFDKGWFTDENVYRWALFRQKDGEPIQSVRDLADCLTDFLYEMKKPGTDDPVLTKEQVIAGKQSLLKGMSMGEIKAIADRVEYTNHLGQTQQEFRENGIYQAAHSDGLGPFIAYVAREQRMDHWGVVPAVIRLGNVGERKFNNGMLESDSVVHLTGKVKKFDKGKAFLSHVSGNGIGLENVAYIDDSAANIPTLQKVQEAGGLAIGFNPTDAHAPKFKEAGIPILNQDEPTLAPFKEIVLDPREAVIGKYCE